MFRFAPVAATFCLAGFLALVSGCARGHETYQPVLEETSTAFLQAEVDKLAEQLAAVRAAEQTPEQAAAALTTAEETVHQLRIYYLPLLEARQHAYNACRHFYQDDHAQVKADLDAVEAILTAMAEAEDSRLLETMKEPLDELSFARLTLDKEPEKAAKTLLDLASRLNLMLLKGGLVLAE